MWEKLKNRFGKDKNPAETYDAEKLRPAIRSSICTGEKTAGFTEIANGRFHEVMLIRNDADLEAFRRRYGIEGEIRIIY